MNILFNSNIYKKIPKNFKNFKIYKIESGASNKRFYKLCNDSTSLILVDFNDDRSEYKNYIKIYESNLIKLFAACTTKYLSDR